MDKETAEKILRAATEPTTSIPYEAINHIENPEAENELGYSLWALDRWKEPDEVMVVLPELTPREMLQLVLLLQYATGETYETEEVERTVFDLYTKIRARWDYNGLQHSTDRHRPDEPQDVRGV
jgi:hypothetical protein